MNLSTLRTHSVVPFDEIRYTFSGLLNLKFSYLQIASGYKDRTATEGPHDVGQKGVATGRRELSLSSLIKGTFL